MGTRPRLLSGRAGHVGCPAVAVNLAYFSILRRGERSCLCTPLLGVILVGTKRRIRIGKRRAKLRRHGCEAGAPRLDDGHLFRYSSFRAAVETHGAGDAHAGQIGVRPVDVAHADGVHPSVGQGRARHAEVHGDGTVPDGDL